MQTWEKNSRKRMTEHNTIFSCLQKSREMTNSLQFLVFYNQKNTEFTEKKKKKNHKQISALIIFKALALLYGNLTDFCRNGYKQHTVNNLQMSKHPIGMQLNKVMHEGVSLSIKKK